MSMRRSIVVSSFLLVFSAGTALAQAPQCEPDRVAQKYPGYAGRTVTIAATPGGPPYSFANPANPANLAGIEVEMIEKVMACAGLRFEYMKGAWSGILAALMSGSGDLMIGNVNYRPDRAERADFLLYMRVGQSIIVQKGNPRNLRDLASLCGATGSATVGGTSSQLIERQSRACVEQGRPAIQFMPAPEADAAYRQLSNARIDFVMDDAVQATAHTAKRPEIEVAHTVTSDILSGMVVKKGNAEMLRIIADGMRVLEQDGSLAAIATKYSFPPDLLIPVQTRQ